MTDEEKAEEYAKGKAHEHYHFLFEENNGSPIDFAKLCYLDGLAEGRKEKWHDLRKNLDDLPTTDLSLVVCYMTDNNIKNHCYDVFYNNDNNFYIFSYSSMKIEVPRVIAWCELPKFEE